MIGYLSNHPDVTLLLSGFCASLAVSILMLLYMIGSTACRSLYEITAILKDLRSMMMRPSEDDDDDVFGAWDRRYTASDFDHGDEPVFDDDRTSIDRDIDDPADASSGACG